jgi:hypothetical protein
VAHGTLIAPPNGWKLLRRKISHSQVGGVTNAFGKIGIYFRDKGGEVEASLELVSCPKHPRRDLRSVLKMAVGGHRCGPPSESLATASATGQVAKHVRPGVVMSSGLLDVKESGNCLRLPRVKTLFGGSMWVIRPLTTPEVLSCWDIPEKLGVLGGTDDKLKSVLQDLTTPMKIRQTILEGLEPVMQKLMSLPTQPAIETSKERDEFSFQPRGPRLHLTSPEEELATFEDKTDPPMNVLVEELKNLELTETADVISKPGIEPSGATKDNKVPIKSEKWDKMLYLGLSDHARSGPWVRAARTIRPLIARHWRRLQLRKWIKYV